MKTAPAPVRVEVTGELPDTAAVMVCEAPGRPMQLRRLPMPRHLQPGEVLVGMRMATICGSDLHTVDGRRREPMPTVLGHEGVGTILAMGAGRAGLAAGDRITWSIADACGACPFCLDFHLPQKCIHLFKYGHSPLDEGSGLNGCYATHLLLRPGTHIVKLPAAVEDAWAVAANCALATVVNAVGRIPPEARSVWVQGAGLLGFFAAALLHERGTPCIHISDMNPARMSQAAALGPSCHPCPTAADERLQHLRDRHPHGLDAVIELAGMKEVVPEAIRLLRPGGHYVLAGLVHPDSLLEVTAEQLIRKCLTLRAVHNYAPEHLEGAVAFLARRGHLLPFGELISQPLPLGYLNEAFALARTGRYARVAIDCQAVQPAYTPAL